MAFRKVLPLAQYARLKKQVYERDGGACVICGRPAVDIHHVIFRSAGGDDDAGNLVALCRECHETKAHGARRKFWQKEFLEYLKKF